MLSKETKEMLGRYLELAAKKEALLNEQEDLDRKIKQECTAPMAVLEVALWQRDDLPFEGEMIVSEGAEKALVLSNAGGDKYIRVLNIYDTLER